jgi:hypothetical protein
VPKPALVAKTKMGLFEGFLLQAIKMKSKTVMNKFDFINPF